MLEQATLMTPLLAASFLVVVDNTTQLIPSPTQYKNFLAFDTRPATHPRHSPSRYDFELSKTTLDDSHSPPSLPPHPPLE